MGNKDEELKSKVFSGLFWKFAERAGCKIVAFLVSLVLARLLTPNDYGIIAIMMVFISLADIIVTSGFGHALVQKKDADALDFSSVFYFCVLLSIVLYFVLFFGAPFVASFYRHELLTPLLRVMGLRLVFSSISTLQNAYIDRNMLFRRYFYSSISATVLSGIVAFIMAYASLGAWALVAQYLIQALVSTMVLWFTVRWRPMLQFSLSRMKTLYSYGWKLLISSLVGALYDDLVGLIIGRLYSSADLGFYSKGKGFPTLITDNLTGTINSVLFPAISTVQEERERVKSMTRRAIKTTAYIVMPLMTGLAVIADPLVNILLTDKWSECVPYLQIACFVGALAPLQTANLQAVKALGRSDITLKLDIIKRLIGVLILVLVMRYGVMAIALSGIVNSIMFLGINMSPNKKLLAYSVKEQLLDVLPFIGMCVAMAVIIYPLLLLNLPNIITLTLQVVIGGGLYIGMSVLFKVESFGYIRETLQPFIKKLKRR